MNVPINSDQACTDKGRHNTSNSDENLYTSVACIVPCFKGGQITLDIVNKLIEMDIVNLVVLVDDCCPYETGSLVSQRTKKTNKLKVIWLKQNLGVGGAIKIGIEYALNQGSDLIIKIDADGQINPDLIALLIEPILSGRAEAAKGNRFSNVDDILLMPRIRIIGNLGLSFLNKVSSGYWELFDPTNGFIAIRGSALKRVRLRKTDDRYFFESDFLFQCALAQISFAQLPMNSVYGDEISSLNPMREITRFARKHLTNFLKRLIYQYFVLDFNAGSLELLGGLMGLLAITFFSIRLLVSGILLNRYVTPGESSIFTVLAIITIQMLIAFLYYDATQQPLMRQLRSRK